MINTQCVFVCCNEEWLICQGSWRIQATVQIWQKKSGGSSNNNNKYRGNVECYWATNMKKKKVADKWRKKRNEREGRRRVANDAALLIRILVVDLMLLLLLLLKRILVFSPTCFSNTINYMSNIWKKKENNTNLYIRVVINRFLSIIQIPVMIEKWVIDMFDLLSNKRSVW